MTIKELKKKYDLKNKDIAEFYDLKEVYYNNSSAKKRYEKALIRFEEVITKQL